MDFTFNHKDTLAELFNIGVGKASSFLSELVGSRVNLTVPSVSVFSKKDIQSELSDYADGNVASVGQKFEGPFSGMALFVLRYDSASRLISLVTDEDENSPDFESIRSATLTEVGNILLNGIIGTLGNIVKKTFTYSLPDYYEGSIDSVVSAGCGDEEAVIVFVKTSFFVEDEEINGDFLYVFEFASFEILRNELDHLGS